MKFYTEEWLADVKAKTNDDADYLKKTKALSVRVQALLCDCPGGLDKMMDVQFQKGKIVESLLEEKPMPSDWRSMPFDANKYMTRLVASYDGFGQIARGEVAAVQAISSGLLSIRGDPMKMMAKIGELNAFLDILKTIPAEY